MFSNIIEMVKALPDEKTCRDYLAKARWENGNAVCPYCGYGKCYVIENGKRYKCGSKTCYRKFSVITGTVFEASNVPLTKWFMAIYLCTAHKKGISSYQLGRDIKVSQKSAWFMLHRIRELMREKTSDKLDNIVEIDETWVGGKVKNMPKYKRAKLRTDNNGTAQNKTMVMGMIERGGKLKLIALGKENNSNVLQPLIRENVDKDAVLMTDTANAYIGINQDFAGHETVNHANDEFGRDGVINTNSIEGAFSLLKRSIIGIYHQVTPKHLSRYCDETMYRYNSRKIKDVERFALSLKNAEGRLRYVTLTKKDAAISNPLPVHNYPAGTILQIKDGEIVGTYTKLKEAAQAVGVNTGTIWKVLKGLKKSSKGYQWKYADK
ncbi:MAG: IS1595 family transposase [Chitinophagaceae bacterium]